MDLVCLGTICELMLVDMPCMLAAAQHVPWLAGAGARLIRSAGGEPHSAHPADWQQLTSGCCRGAAG